MARQYEPQVAFVGVTAHDTIERMVEFVERNDVGFIPHVVDEELAAWSRYRIPGHGAWVFINGETGEEVPRLGELGTEGLIEAMNEVFGIAGQPG